MASIAVLGAGSWGTALALVLARNGHSVYLWAKNLSHIEAMQRERQNKQYLAGVEFPVNLKVEAQLATVLQHIDEILIATPSHAFQEIITRIKPYLKAGQGISWATKGLDPSARFLDEVVRDITGDRPMALLTGPSFAREVAENLPTAVVVASNNADYGRTIQALFQASCFRVYRSEDLIGAEIGGAVKNVLALAVGMAEGLGFHTNTKAALMTRGLAEMMRLGEALGAKRETLTGLSGLGDLILTCSDPQSRNLRFGRLLGEGMNKTEACQKIGQVVESIGTTEIICKLARQYSINMPISEAVYSILYENISIKAIIKALISREAYQE